VLGQELRAFLDGKRPDAEVNRAPSWDARATIESALPAYVAPKIPVRSRRPWPILASLTAEYRSVIWALLAGLVIGLIGFIPASYLRRYWIDSAPLRTGRDYRIAAPADIEKDWSLLQDLQRRYGYLGRFSPESYFLGSMEGQLATAGNEVLERYENSTEPGIEQYDWERARLCFERLAFSAKNSADWRGRLATATGFVKLTRTPSDAKEAAASFRSAIALAPRLMAPHLGLAWIHVYKSANPGMAQAEFQAAENVGHRLGPREKEQQADAYLSRAELEVKEWRKARTDDDRTRSAGILERDFDRARRLYEPIAGYSKVNESLRRLEKDEKEFRDAAAARERALEEARKKARNRRWR